MLLWLRSDAGTFTTSAMTTAAVADADPVGGWADQSGRGNHATQATAGKRPALKLAIQNGRSVLRFTAASSQGLYANGIATALAGSDKPFTMLVVAKQNSAVAANALLMLCSTVDNDTRHHFDADGTNYRSLRRDDVAAIKTLVGGTPDTSFHVLCSRFTGTIGQLFRNGTQLGADTDLDVGAATFDQFGVGGMEAQAATSYLDGDIGEVLVYDSAIPVTDRRAVEGYLKARWGTA